MIQSVSRAIAILESIAHAGGSAHLQEIAATTGLKSTTTHNILKTLQAEGYVRRRTRDKRYHLGDRILNLARIAGDDAVLRRRLRPALDEIAERTRETVFVAVPSGDEVYFLDAIESPEPLKAASQQGERTPMEGSAIGLLFLAFIPVLRKRMLKVHAERIGSGLDAELEAIAARGYALDQENYLAGLNCIAVPWMDDGEIRAGYGVSGPTARLPADRLKEIAAIVGDVIGEV